MFIQRTLLELPGKIEKQRRLTTWYYSFLLQEVPGTLYKFIVLYFKLNSIA